MLYGKVIILHDSARPNVAVACQTLSWQIYWDVLEHLPYSPDFSPCEYSIFGPLQNSLKGWRFPDDNEVQAAVENWFHNQHRIFFTQGIHHVVNRWETYFNRQARTY
ncbi:uncharacterized protein TNCV_2833491 [Trichonephila clavipes]|nr:uncharacterized protein TNCV_2833491 [Trichonephila clavipes]